MWSVRSSAVANTLKAVAVLPCLAKGLAHDPRKHGHRPCPPGALEDVLLNTTAGQKFHVTHRLGYYRGVTFCWKCGSYAAWRVQGLGGHCAGTLRGSGKYALHKLRISERPQNLNRWPLDDASDRMLIPFDPDIDGDAPNNSELFE